jgi:GGDEF domain-containing protein
MLMTDPRFYDSASGLLTREAFSFIVDHQLKRAQRVQEYITLVVFVVERRWRELIVEHDWRERVVPADDGIVKEMARLILYAVRSTDLLARTASGAVSLLLAGVDGERSRDVIARVNGHLRRYRATPALQINVGVASCPSDAVRVDDLIRTARRRAARGALSARRAGDEGDVTKTSDRINGAHLDPARSTGTTPHAGGEPMARPTSFVERRSPTPRPLREH